MSTPQQNKRAMPPTERQARTKRTKLVKPSERYFKEIKRASTIISLTFENRLEAVLELLRDFMKLEDYVPGETPNSYELFYEHFDLRNSICWKLHELDPSNIDDLLILKNVNPIQVTKTRFLAWVNFRLRMYAKSVNIHIVDRLNSVQVVGPSDDEEGFTTAEDDDNLGEEYTM